MNKSELHEHCLELLQQKIAGLRFELNAAQEAVNAETKSSAGDKHETGREMARQEVNKLGSQYELSMRTFEMASKVTFASNSDQVQLGSLVQTNHGLFYLLVSLGKISYREQEIFVISMQSPIGQQLMHKAKGNSFKWMNKEYTIEAIS